MLVYLDLRRTLYYQNSGSESACYAELNNIFDKNQYNFSSTEFSALLSAFPEGTLTLLLPDPTSREMARHVSEKAEEMIRALTKARMDAPFVTKLPFWPEREGHRALADTMIKDINARMDVFLIDLCITD